MKHLLEWLEFKKLTISSVAENVKQLEFSYTTGGSVKWHSHFGKVEQFLKKWNMHLSCDSATLILCISVSVFSSVTQLCPTLCDPMNHNTRPPCPSPTPRVYPNSCPLSRWCHPTISSCHPLLTMSLHWHNPLFFSKFSLQRSAL